MLSQVNQLLEIVVKPCHGTQQWSNAVKPVVDQEVGPAVDQGCQDARGRDVLACCRSSKSQP